MSRPKRRDTRAKDAAAIEAAHLLLAVASPFDAHPVPARERKRGVDEREDCASMEGGEEGGVFEKDAKTSALRPGVAAARRTAIGFFYVHHFGSPPEPE